MTCDLPDFLNWARLRELADGSAEVFDCAGGTTRFATSEEARDALAEDEFATFDEKFRATYRHVRWEGVAIPSALDDEALVPKMFVTIT
jgi:hypothetical protein